MILLQKRAERGSEEAQMYVDFVNLMQNNYITEEKDEYWQKLQKDFADYIDKFKNVDNLFVTTVVDKLITYFDVKHSATKHKVGEEFSCCGGIYKVIKSKNGNDAVYVRKDKESRVYERKC